MDFFSFNVASLLPWLTDKCLNLYQNQKEAKTWIPRLNAMFENEVKIYRRYSKEPEIHIEGTVELTPEQEKFAEMKRHQINERTPIGANDPHAILTHDPHWDDDPVHLHVKTLNYASVCALREPGISSNVKPEIISANALIICQETKEIVLHRRSEDSATFPGRLHTFGGAYWPSKINEKGEDLLSHTAMREVQEESKASLNIVDNPPIMLVMKEIDTGFIQLAFIGVNISQKQVEKLRENPEGKITLVSFDDLGRRLKAERDWVPTGKVAIMAWLALNAPNSGRRVKFNGVSATKLFDQLVP